MDLPPGSPKGRLGLSRNAVGLREVVFQSITGMAPAGAVAFALTYVASAAGGALPLSLLLAMIPSLMVASTVAQFAKKLPSAGGYYTYTSSGLGPGAGFLTAWFYLFYEPLMPSTVFAVVGFLVQTTFPKVFGIPIPWYVWSVAGILLLYFITYRSIHASAKVASVLGVLEIGIFLMLALSILFSAPHTPGVAPFTPGASLNHGWSSVLLGMVFGVFTFAGFETAAPLGEESRHPRKTVGRAVLLASVIIGLFYMISAYAAITGWGLDKMSSYALSSNPWNVLAHRYWGWGWILIFLALMNSQMGNGIASQTACTRVLYAMGRIGVLPKSFAFIHPKYRIPSTSLNVQTIITLVLTLGTGFLFGPFAASQLIAEVLTLSLIMVYILGNVALVFFYRREYPNEFSWWLHGFFPIVSSVFLLIALYGSIFPVPAYPMNLPPYIVLVWIVIGFAVLAYLKRNRPEAIKAARHIVIQDQDQDMDHAR
ncbi:amino acid transporter [Scopulibacillus daqui]|uniref:Amino acid transporter n=1 Tax=Scopulibacillus daqui TaxID=1469162 RepID=A0ABS2PY22_9BACL|nr:APC family permease [Scopulibacillus daqui]MBM7644605.1 amino acid transporter [Scopulibacillus daqui]